MFCDIAAMMLVEELLRHQRLIGDVGMPDHRRRGPRARIQLGTGRTTATWRHILVVE